MLQSSWMEAAAGREGAVCRDTPGTVPVSMPQGKSSEPAGEKDIEALTLFAFSSENWRRPREEVDWLMGLFTTALDREAHNLHSHNVRLEVVGERHVLDKMLLRRMVQTEELTRANTGLRLTIAMNYGGRWDVTQACREIALRVREGEAGSGIHHPRNRGTASCRCRNCRRPTFSFAQVARCE